MYTVLWPANSYILWIFPFQFESLWFSPDSNVKHWIKKIWRKCTVLCGSWFISISFSLLMLYLMLIIRLLWIAFIMFNYLPCIFCLSNTFFLSWTGVGFCQGISQHLMRWSYVLFCFQCVYSVDYIDRIFLVCWTIPKSLSWTLLDHLDDILDGF